MQTNIKKKNLYREKLINFRKPLKGWLNVLCDQKNARTEICLSQIIDDIVILRKGNHAKCSE
jgi:hypothetical protein